IPGGIAVALALAAMALTRTRAAVVASIVVLFTVTIWRVTTRLRWSAERALLVSAGLGAVVGVVTIVINPLHVLAANASRSLEYRVEMGTAALRMIKAVPVMGVGVGQYEARYPDFASQELMRHYPTTNAHDYFLWIGAELGVVGLALFLWVIGVCLARAW